MLIQKQRPAIQTKIKSLQRRPSSVLLSALSSREEAERLKSDIEARSLFKELLTRGIVRKAHLRGLIPRDKYLSYRLKEAIAFINRYDLESQPEWSQVFNNARTEEYIDQLAQRWKVPQRELRRLLRLLSAPSSERDSYQSVTPLAEDKLSATTVVLDLGDNVEIIARFVSRYGLSQQDFVNYILSGNYDAQELSARFGCEVREAEIVLNSLSHLEIVEAFTVDTAVHASGLPGTNIPVAENVIAEAHMTSAARLQVRFLDKQVSALYLINYEELEQWQERSSGHAELRSLLQAIQALNERNGALANIVQTISSIQVEFIASGDLSNLRPLSQSEVALRVGYHRSIVSRLIRGQRVLILNRTHSLADLMPRTQEVIARLIDVHPGWTDSQVKKYLTERFNLRISQRAVNYHRNALAKGAKGR
jgi:antitoxin component HigA of HigAB toxin-antitoxin module